eukprot:2977497-Rhodomonas_salina.1
MMILLLPVLGNFAGRLEKCFENPEEVSRNNPRHDKKAWVLLDTLWAMLDSLWDMLDTLGVAPAAKIVWNSRPNGTFSPGKRNIV